MYTIEMRETGAVILQDGVEVSVQVGYLLLRSLRRRYERPCYVYLGFSPTLNLWKIGLSRNVERRAEQLQIEIKHIIPCDELYEAAFLESMLHDIYVEKRVQGEWFALTDQQVLGICNQISSSQLDPILIIQGYDALFKFKELQEEPYRSHLLDAGQRAISWAESLVAVLRSAGTEFPPRQYMHLFPEALRRKKRGT
jgi:hypothetical protein